MSKKFSKKLFMENQTKTSDGSIYLYILCNAIISVVALRDLIRVRYYYPDAIEKTEARKLHNELIEHIESSFNNPAFEKFKKIYKRPEFDNLKADAEMSILFGIRPDNRTMIYWSDYGESIIYSQQSLSENRYRFSDTEKR
jgi:hypothetical protein